MLKRGEVFRISALQINMIHHHRIVLTLIGLAALLPACHADGATVEWIASTENAPFVSQPSFAMQSSGDVPGAVSLNIDPSNTDQRMTGWGGCFNELGWKALLTLAPKDREAVIAALFDPKAGLRFNICRMPIGASDFALDGYSLDDTPDDFDLKNFSIDRDRQLLIPYIKAAMQYRPDLKIWASPWSPPGWMKDDGVYYSGHLRMEPKILDAYARYLAQFAIDYRKEGVDLYAVHVQNEPVSDSKYPTCVWHQPGPMRDFIRDYLGPTFAREHVPAQIWLGTMSESRMGWFKTILDDPGAAKYISGIGLQYEGRKAAAQLHLQYPDIPLMETETRCDRGQNSWKDAEGTFQMMEQFIGGGCGSYMYWNMVLDETGLSSWHWRQNSTIVIDTKNKSVIFTPAFYLMKHFSAFVAPGALRLRTTTIGTGADALAFKNEDGSIVVVIANTAKTELAVAMKIAHRVASVKIAAHSFNTFISREGVDARAH